MIKITSNGSKWGGEEPDNLDILEVKLKEHTLDPRFEDYGNFAYEEKGIFYLFGNFIDISSVFNVAFDMENYNKFITLKKLCRLNQKTQGYLEARKEIKTKVKP